MKIPIQASELKTGQRIRITRKDGTVLVFGQTEVNGTVDHVHPDWISVGGTDFLTAACHFEREFPHSELVAALVKPGEDIIASLTPQKAHLWHMASAVCGEAGELFDAIKKGAIYNKEIDRENVIEELGDLEFYLEGIRASLGITREETTEANITKLRARYESKTGVLAYTDKAAQERADKVEDPYAGWTFDPPHYVDSEDCMGVPDQFHRVFAKGPNGEIASGSSRDSAERALEKCRENVREKKNLTT